MQYIKLLCSVLLLCLMIPANAFATTVDGASATDDIPDWALVPALEPGEEPADETDASTADDPGSERGYTTIYNSDGTLRYTDDPALLADPSLFAAAEAADNGLFLSKSFDEYTVTEGFLLLFLILGFCWALWKIIKGVF